MKTTCIAFYSGNRTTQYKKTTFTPFSIIAAG